jgi:hypothetical protein
MRRTIEHRHRGTLLPSPKPPNRVKARRTLRIVSVALLAAALPAPASAEIYRCTVEGKTVYSDSPCGNAPVIVDVAPSPPPAQPSSPDLQYEAGMGRVTVGQTPAQVEQAWGRPSAINTDVRANGLREQWVYRRDGANVYVYLEKGRVTSISTRNRAAAQAQQPMRQPTKAERDAQERAAKAAERKHVTVGMRLNQADVRARLGEPDRKQHGGGMELWTYLPADLDYQTRTTIKFRRDGTVFDVERVIQR